jgi:hypothetical protein
MLLVLNRFEGRIIRSFSSGRRCRLTDAAQVGRENILFLGTGMHGLTPFQFEEGGFAALLIAKNTDEKKHFQ